MGFGMQWHQLDHMQTICTWLHADNYNKTPSLNVYNFYKPDALPDAQPTVSKHWKTHTHTYTSATNLWSQIMSLMKWTQQQKFSCCCSSYLEQSPRTFALALHHQRTELVWLEKPPLPAGLKKVKVAHTQLLSMGFRSWSRFLVVSLQVTWVINPAVGCHYFPPGPQLPSQLLRGLLPISLLGEQRHDVNSLPKTVTRQRCCCDLNLGPSALESSILIISATEPHPSRPTTSKTFSFRAY